MKITVLVENHAQVAFDGAHGLSLLIETGGLRLLFDFGPNGDILLENAKKLHVDLNSVDLAALSHGHYDHSGGLEAFLKANDHAPVYVQRGAFEGHFAKMGGGARDIGADASLPAQYADRLRYVDEAAEIAEGITLFAHVPIESAPSVAYTSFLTPAPGGGFVQDRFGHEMNLLVREGGHLALFSGCAHQGILNILGRAEQLAGASPDAVVAGLHLMSEPPQTAEAVGEELLRRRLRCWTGHCTGMDAYGTLCGILGRRVHYMAAGASFEIGDEA